jgi:hypothetical protein
MTSKSRPVNIASNVLSLLENVLQSKLKISFSALARHLTEGAAGGISVGAIPIWVVQDIEYLKPELQALPFRNREVLAKAHIPAQVTWIPQKIPFLLPESAGCRLSERVLIKPDSGIGKGGRLQVGVANQIIELIAAPRSHTREVVVAAYGERRSGLRLEDSGNFPIAQQSSAHCGTAFERQLVDVIQN